MFLFVDETGCDRKNAARKFGYSLRGFPAKSFRFFSRGKRISTIGLMSTTTFLDCYTIEGTVDGDVFLQICAVVSASTPDAIQWYKPK